MIHTTDRVKSNGASIPLAALVVAILGASSVSGGEGTAAKSPSEKREGRGTRESIFSCFEQGPTPPVIDPHRGRLGKPQPEPVQILPYKRDVPVWKENVWGEEREFAQRAPTENSAAAYVGMVCVIIWIGVFALVIGTVIKQVRSKCPACGRHGFRETGEVKRQVWFKPNLEECRCCHCGHIEWREEYEPPAGD